MKKLLVAGLLVSGFALQAKEPHVCMEEIKVSYQKEKSLTVKDFIIAGVLAGGTVELANYIRKDQNYKKVLAFAMDYPGVFVATVSASAGLVYMYGKGFKDFIARCKLAAQSK